jgi:uncharacterized LabA/DUF88 family protein
MANIIAYVDGFNLYYGLHEKYDHRYLWLDLEELVRRLRPRDNIVSVKYFTSHVLDDPLALDRQLTYLDALKAKSSDTIEIILGRYSSKPVSCHRCGSTWTRYEEKETDVNIAVSLVADTAASASDIALIISADSDLCPAIRMIRRLDKRRGLIGAFPPRRRSLEIKALVPAMIHIGASDLRNSLLPDSVTDRTTGRTFKRPSKWT